MARGRLRPLHPGVYRVGPIIQPHTYEMAAVLACGPGAALSHHSATYLYELLPNPVNPGPIHVTVPGGHIRRLRNVRVHRASLRPWEIRERDNIPITAPIRTILDLAACASDDELELAVAEACALRLITAPQLSRAIVPGRRGAARLRTLLDAGPKRTRSTPERLLLTALRSAGISGFRTNTRIGHWEVDFYWPAHRLAVEVDGYASHSSPRAFERDRRKDAELTGMGIEVRRFSANQVRDELDQIIAWIRVRPGRS